MIQNSDPIAQFRYENLLIPKLRDIIATAPIALIPIGILEWHGNHNALGMDGSVAEHLCGRVMSLLKRGVLFPVHWIGTYGYVHYEGTICYEEAVIIQYLTQLLSQVVKLGFKLIFLISGHGGKWQQNAIQTAVKNASTFAAKTPKELNIVGVVYPDLAPEVNVTHAGLEETAMLWRIGNLKGVKLVDMQYFSSNPEDLNLYSLNDESRVPIQEDRHWDWTHIFPHPEKCSPELGENILTTITEGILEEIKEYCEEMHI